MFGQIRVGPRNVTLVVDAWSFPLLEDKMSLFLVLNPISLFWPLLHLSARLSSGPHPPHVGLLFFSLQASLTKPAGPLHFSSWKKEKPVAPLPHPGCSVLMSAVTLREGQLTALL